MTQVETNVRDVIASIQRQQLDKPTFAVVNSESAFVNAKLRASGYTDVAMRYWAWVCQFRGSDEDRQEFGDEVFNLQIELENVDKQSTMPLWGTYGT